MDLLKVLPDSSRTKNFDIFLKYENLLEKIVLCDENISSTKEDDMLLAESIIRSYLTHFRSIFSYQHSSTFLSLSDLFIYMEYRLLKSLEKDLCHQMENLLEIFAGIEIPSSNTSQFIRSILYDSNSNIGNFVSNYGLTLKHISEMKSNNINLRFIRRRKEFLEIMRLERDRQKHNNRVFHVC